MTAFSARITAAHVTAHRFAVTLTLASPRHATQAFRLPGWLRGSYLVRDFAKHVQGLRVTQPGVERAIRRTDKHRFVAEDLAPGVAVEVSYEVFAHDPSVRKAWLDEDRAFFNFSSLVYVAEGLEDSAIGITLDAPENPGAAAWKVATTLRAVAVDARGFGAYEARNYEDLIDQPVEMADFQRFDFIADGIAHALVVSGLGKKTFDAGRVTKDLTAICEVERAMFGHEPAMLQYLFLTNAVASGYGGLEHRESTALVCARSDLPTLDDTTEDGKPGSMSKAYRTFLGLCSHEYFHLWNVKRITPEIFAASDLSREAHSADLWHYEGVTSYYDDLFLVRAGVIDVAAYLDLLAGTLTRLERQPGRHVQTLADASFETWIKYYQPDENTPNAAVNYYVKGAVVALCLDMDLRARTVTSLDDALRLLWTHYGRGDIPAPEGALEAASIEVSGLADLRHDFDGWLRTTAELPIARALKTVGVKAVRRPTLGAKDDGGVQPGTPPRAWAGVAFRPDGHTVASVREGAPAQLAGLTAGDIVVAVDGEKAAGNAAALVAGARVGEATVVHVFRDDRLRELSLNPIAAPADTWVLVLDDTADAATLARRTAWLSRDGRATLGE